MRLILYMLLIAISGCTFDENQGAVLTHKSFDIFEVRFNNVGTNLCASDYFINLSGKTEGQSLEIVDENGKPQLFNSGYHLIDTDVDLRNTIVASRSYIIRANYALDVGKIYKARLNLVTFPCGNIKKEYSYLSYEHINYYGMPDPSILVIKSNWVTFRFEGRGELR